VLETVVLTFLITFGDLYFHGGGDGQHSGSAGSAVMLKLYTTTVDLLDAFI
jgi:hypothetical protein